ncbi:diguanylate cyclase [Pseudidiomarina sp. 1APR75-33.1]|uniref:GGDEF domain-containing response regulator n=1 Tax=Pseudidiomarina terrestris TaxID=2820060 RepID=UPI00265014C8|nr:diguanylate cyclase [Pseudidiomarina sp. 1APR75-33.1]MDN7128189.1 diguanylate cyclase [Pseudidiomarina sp. 1APR75-33.1]
MTEDFCILIIDDSDDDREFISHLLSVSEHTASWTIDQAENGSEGVALVKSNHFDCVLLDYSLPGHNGVEVMKQIRMVNAEVPVVIMTGQGNEEIAVAAMKAGAQDYLSKNSLNDADRVSATIIEAIEQRRQEIETIQRANYDHLTGLVGRALLDDRLNSAVHRHARRDTNFAVVFLDLDGLKEINDEYGHAAGDIMLRRFADCLDSSSRDGDTVARLSGDEFVVICESLPDEQPKASCRNFLVRLSENIHKTQVKLNGREVHLKASLGASVYPLHGTSPTQLLKIADEAMYKAKKRPHVTFCIGDEP